jgi:hypothetical protein
MGWARPPCNVAKTEPRCSDLLLRSAIPWCSNHRLKDEEQRQPTQRWRNDQHGRDNAVASRTCRWIESSASLLSQSPCERLQHSTPRGQGEITLPLRDLGALFKSGLCIVAFEGRVEGTGSRRRCTSARRFRQAECKPDGPARKALTVLVPLPHWFLYHDRVTALVA